MTHPRTPLASRALGSFTALLLLVPACFEPDPETSGTEETDGDDSTTSSTPASTSDAAPETSGDDTTGAPDPDNGDEEGTSSTGGEDEDSSTGTTSFDDDSSSGGDTSTGADVTPPQVVNISPADGSTSVTDEPVVIEFDEPIDTTTLEVAFPAGTDFVWSNDDTTVEFSLPYPFGETQASFDIVVPTTVTDVAGNALEAEAVSSIVLAGLHTVELDFDAGLTGNNTGTWFYAGDTSTNVDRFGGATFPLGALPAFDSILALRSATLATQVIDVAGTPADEEAGGYVLDHVEFASRGAIANPTMLDSAFAQFVVSESVEPGNAIEVDVSARFEASWSDEAELFQVRVRLADLLVNDVADVAWFRRGADENDSIVADGVLEPDAYHRLRVVVEYFTAN